MEQKNEQAQRLNAINEREKKTNDSVIRMRTNLENVQEEIRKLSAQAIDLYGSDEVGVLRERYVTDNQENEAAIAARDESVTLRAQLVSTIEDNTAKLRLN
ncbi:hypothetical protein [Pseudomonas sp. PLMAX]|jgi:hypothetical protein|uniref:hypothetical protein n=1 Tax=Pseudomonas sp. PLMAX TaxID=2201998 RepID=UPI0038BDBEB1